MRAVFEGRVVPPKQQAEWLSMISKRPARPIAEVSDADPSGFSLGLAQRHGAGRQGLVLPGRHPRLPHALCLVRGRDILVTVQTNCQPPDGEDRIGELAGQLQAIVKPLAHPAKAR